MNGFSERERKIDKLLRVELQRQISAKVVRMCAREVAKAAAGGPSYGASNE